VSAESDEGESTGASVGIRVGTTQGAVDIVCAVFGQKSVGHL